jgi:sugar (pentulose or hexulose) kinase
MNILFDNEHVTIDKLLGHGGFFKTKEVGQRIMASALNTPVAVMETAGEGGAWGMAILSAYMLEKVQNESLEDYLESKVFAGERGSTSYPDPNLAASFADFISRYEKGLSIERAAVEAMR